MPKDTSVTIRIDSKYLSRIDELGLENSGFIRDAVKEKLERESEGFLDRQILEYKNKLKVLEQTKKNFTKLKTPEKLTDEEKEFLLSSKKIIDKHPEYLDGRMKNYSNTFKKGKVTKNHFIKLIKEVEE